MRAMSTARVPSTSGRDRVGGWAWQIASVLDALHLPAWGAVVTVVPFVLGPTAWRLTMAAILLAQAAFGSCPLVVATDWLRRREQPDRRPRAGIVAQSFRRPRVRILAAMAAIAIAVQASL
jgi:hypothetical protein